ncbi:sensor histidine kinase [Alteromonas sp. 1_MG-2023]|uniref:sensor histidine kinase n=1 Tax=Alteromonas sp. 1_MG-2023 TaxID=3062669 RepID=UPI0026E42340|nr:sensor histidine kinase [Alteromonas sp. 1_MG-2023]MDO6567215.1 sensor histidine kinase [Alteromonas sp. 1_MG-2023]
MNSNSIKNSDKATSGTGINTSGAGFNAGETSANLQSPTLPLLADGRKKKWSYSSLVFSLFYFVPMLFMQDAPSNSVMALIVTGFVTFVFLYVLSVNQPVNRLPYYLTLMIFLAYTTSLVNPGGTVIFGFVNFIVGYYYRFSIGIILLLAVSASLIFMKVFLYPTGLFFFLAAGVNIAVLFGFGVMERKETLFQQKEAKHAAALGTLSAIAERERIGRDLHDVAGHALSSISLKAQVADKLLTKGRTAEAQAEVKALAQLSQQLLSEIRQTVSGIKHLPLRQEIAKNMAKLSEQGFEVVSDVVSDVISSEASDDVGDIVNNEVNNVDESNFTHLTPLQETQMSLIVKEATTNILRHSKGNQVTLTLQCTNDMLNLVIADNGNSHCQAEGNGVQGIRERAELINASVEFQWGSPTVLTLQLPLLAKHNNSQPSEEYICI